MNLSISLESLESQKSWHLFLHHSYRIQENLCGQKGESDVSLFYWYKRSARKCDQVKKAVLHFISTFLPMSKRGMENDHLCYRLQDSVTLRQKHNRAFYKTVIRKTATRFYIYVTCVQDNIALKRNLARFLIIFSKGKCVNKKKGTSW